MTKNTTYSKVNKVLIYYGLFFLVMSCIASIFGAYHNRDFIREPLEVFYYLRYLLLIGGGFMAGYFLNRTNKKHSDLQNRLLSGTSYSLIALTLFYFTDILRLVLQNTLGEKLQFPWGKYIFLGSPLIAALFVLILILYAQYYRRNSELSNLSKWIFILIFIVNQLYSYTYLLIGTMNGTISNGTDIPFLHILLTYVLNPIVVFMVAFIALRSVTPLLRRLFYATYISAVSYFSMLVLWEFRTDATDGPTTVFGIITMILVFLFTAGILTQAYLGAKRSTKIT